MARVRPSYVLALSLLFTAVAVRAQQDLSKVEIKVTKMSGNVYTLEGSRTGRRAAHEADRRLRREGAWRRNDRRSFRWTVVRGAENAVRTLNT